MLIRSLFILLVMASLTNLCSGQEVHITKVLTPYVNGVEKTPPRAFFRDRDTLKSIATFSVENTGNVDIYVKAVCKLYAVDGATQTALVTSDLGIKKIEPDDDPLDYTDFGVEFQTGAPAAPDYVVRLTWEVSTDPNVADPLQILAEGGFQNRFEHQDK